MGGMNQTRYSAPAANSTGYHPKAGSHQQTGVVGFASLPEYQANPAKRQQTSSSSTNDMYNQQQPAAAPRNQSSYRPRQHLVPAAPQQHQQYDSAQQQPMSDSSSTRSATSQQEGSDQTESFHYNPYDTKCSRVTSQHQNQYQNQNQQYEVASHHQQHQQQQYYDEYAEQSQMAEAPLQSTLPFGTLHGNLEGYVRFVPYPTEQFVNPTKQNQVPCEGNLSRVFLGQLPYQVTDMQLDWLCYTFGNGGGVHFPERITKHDAMRGCKVPTGCIHAYADNELVGPMLQAMHKRLLVDDTGVWFADSREEQAYLNDYCLMMKNDRTKRYQNRPYDTVVAQFATSSFVRRH